MNSRCARNCRLFVPFKVLLGLCGFCYPCVLLVHRAVGLSNGDIAWLQAWFGASFAPVLLVGGYLADRWGRKRSLMIGALGSAIAWLLYGVAHASIDLAIAEMTLALAIGAIIGAEHALIYDSLLAQHREAEHPSLRSRAYACANVTVGVAGVAGAALALRSLEAPFLVGTVAACVAGVMAFFMSEPPRVHARRGAFLADMARLRSELQRGSPALRRLIVVGALLVGISMGSMSLFSVAYTEMGISTEWFGVLGLVVNGIAGAGVVVVPRLFSFVGRERAVPLTVLLFAVAVGAMATAPWWLAVCGAVLFFWTRGFQDTVVPDLLNAQVTSEDRASFNALVPALGRVIQSLLLLSLSGIAQRYSARAALVCFALLGGVVLVWYWKGNEGV